MVKNPEMPQILTESFTDSVSRSPIELSLDEHDHDHAMSF